MRLNIVNCFCSNIKNSGNPAAVVVDYFGDRAAKQALAYKLNLPVTVFITKSDGSTPILEYFYPETEMPLCLHGTLAAASVLFTETSSSKLLCKTFQGNILTLFKEEGLAKVKVSAQVSPNILIAKNDICAMLNIKSASYLEVNLPLTISSVGSPKLLVPVDSLNTLAKLKPNFELIRNWSIKHQVNGLYIYTNETYSPEASFHARGFNPKTGYNEDIATGVAAAALALALKKDIVVEQGHCLGRQSKIIVSYQNHENIFVGGKASIDKFPVFRFAPYGLRFNQT